MSKIELPPLPEPELTIGVKLVPYEERTFRSASLATKLGYGDDQRRYFTASQLRARDRQIVELCASLCKSLMPQNDRSDWTEYAQMSADALSRAEDAIRSLLDPAEKEMK